MKFCSQCASPVAVRIPDGDTLERHVCDACGQIHYQNPKIIAGCIPHWQGRILLCRRAIEPRHGLWTIPAGFMENGETIEQAAMRETYEEACARVEISGLYAIFNIPHVSQVYMIFRAELLDGEFAPGIEIDRALLRLSHMQKDTYYVQICDELSYMYLCKHSDVQHDLHII